MRTGKKLPTQGTGADSIRIKRTATAGKVVELLVEIVEKVIKLVALLLLFGLASIGLTALLNEASREVMLQIIKSATGIGGFGL